MGYAMADKFCPGKSMQEPGVCLFYLLGIDRCKQSGIAAELASYRMQDYPEMVHGHCSVASSDELPMQIFLRLSVRFHRHLVSLSHGCAFRTVHLSLHFRAP